MENLSGSSIENLVSFFWSYWSQCESSKNTVSSRLGVARRTEKSRRRRRKGKILEPEVAPRKLERSMKSSSCRKRSFRMIWTMWKMRTERKD